MNISYMTAEERAEYLAGEAIERARQGRADLAVLLPAWERSESSVFRRVAELVRKELGEELPLLIQRAARLATERRALEIRSERARILETLSSLEMDHPSDRAFALELQGELASLRAEERIARAARNAVRLSVCGPASRAARLERAVANMPGGLEAIRAARNTPH
jgi:hypothetical protein